jgi:hypothetical protein
VSEPEPADHAAADPLGERGQIDVTRAASATAGR